MDDPKASVPARGSADDLGKMPIERVLATLSVTPAKGLSSAEAQKGLAQYGPNALVEKKKASSRRSSSLSPGRLPI
jgi:cation transport ATPase-like protein